jgi:hypothetical protein
LNRKFLGEDDESVFATEGKIVDDIEGLPIVANHYIMITNPSKLFSAFSDAFHPTLNAICEHHHQQSAYYNCA